MLHRSSPFDSSKTNFVAFVLSKNAREPNVEAGFRSVFTYRSCIGLLARKVAMEELSSMPASEAYLPANLRHRTMVMTDPFML